MKTASLCFVALSLLPVLAFAAGDNPWPSFKVPAEGPARAIGEYSAGCLQGAEALSLDGVGYQVMHPSRNRYYGHPALVSFVRALGRAVHEQGLGVVLIGDLSQPRGGRAPGGHSSHQSGLDVDVWYVHPKAAKKAKLSPEQRETLSARSVLDGKRKAVRTPFRDRVFKLLRIAAEDERVDRVFVHPLIKRDLCSDPSVERGFLRKIRPWHGHDDHFHARLACPSQSPDCKPQPAIEEGDGCNELDFWLSPEAAEERKRAQETYQRNVVTGRGAPAACEKLLQ